MLLSLTHSCVLLNDHFFPASTLTDGVQWLNPNHTPRMFWNVLEAKSEHQDAPREAPHPQTSVLLLWGLVWRGVAPARLASLDPRASSRLWSQPRRFPRTPSISSTGWMCSLLPGKAGKRAEEELLCPYKADGCPDPQAPTCESSRASRGPAPDPLNPFL